MCYYYRLWRYAYGGAVNDNLVCLFGPTNPKRLLPFGKNIKYIWSDKDRYDHRYEMFGTQPRDNNFFEKLKTKDVLSLLMKNDNTLKIKI